MKQDLERLTRDELLALAREAGVSGRSRMTKAQLAAALQSGDAGAQVDGSAPASRRGGSGAGPARGSARESGRAGAPSKKPRAKPAARTARPAKKSSAATTRGSRAGAKAGLGKAAGARTRAGAGKGAGKPAAGPGTRTTKRGGPAKGRAASKSGAESAKRPTAKRPAPKATAPEAPARSATKAATRSGGRVRSSSESRAAIGPQEPSVVGLPSQEEGATVSAAAKPSASPSASPTTTRSRSAGSAREAIFGAGVVSGELNALESAPSSAPAGLRRRANNHAVLLALDPWRAHCYWSVTSLALDGARRRVDSGSSEPLTLRVYELPVASATGYENCEFFDVSVDGLSGNYYLNLWAPGKSLVAEVGVKGATGQFVAIVRSNVISLPRGTKTEVYEDRRRRVRSPGPSEWSRAGWLVAESVVDPNSLGVVRAAGGAKDPDFAGVTAEVGSEIGADAALSLYDDEEPPWLRRLALGLSSGQLVGVGLSSGAVGVSSWSANAQAGSGEARLEVQADVVIYGRAQPGSQVLLGGRVVPVGADGLFQARFALPASALPNGAWRVRSAGHVGTVSVESATSEDEGDPGDEPLFRALTKSPAVELVE